MIRLVLRNLPTEALMATRLTNHTLCNASDPFLFDTVYIAPNYADMERARMVCSRYGPQIRFLAYCPAHYEAWNYGDFVGCCGYYTSSCSESNIHRLWELFCTLADEHQTVVESGEFEAHFRQILGSLTNLRQVILTNKIRLRGNCPCRQGAFDAGSRRINPITDVASILRATSSLDPGHSCVVNQEALDYDDSTPWLDTLNALALSESQATEIIVEPSGIVPYTGQNEVFLRMEALCYTPDTLQHINRTLFGLSTLVLSLELPYFDYVYDVEILKGPTTLSAAVNLRSLTVHISDDRENRSEWQREYFLDIFDTLLGACKFPQLKTLALRNIDGTEAQFLQFLGGSPLLSKLSLNRIWLWAGTWASFLDELRRDWPLKSAFVDYAGGMEGAYCEGLKPRSEDWCDWGSTVSDFFYQNGYVLIGLSTITETGSTNSRYDRANPFLKETWAAIDRSRGQKREQQLMEDLRS